MIKDIQGGKINLVITKDLSILSIDYIHTGYYTEIYFPEHNVYIKKRTIIIILIVLFTIRN